jgi:hypothetical protein
VLVILRLDADNTQRGVAEVELEGRIERALVPQEQWIAPSWRVLEANCGRTERSVGPPGGHRSRGRRRVSRQVAK